MALIQLLYTNIPEIDGLSFALQGNVAAAQDFTVLFYRGIVAVYHAPSYLRF